MALAAPAAGAQKVFPARLLVYAQEWSLQPSRASLPAGPVVVQLWNRGQDPRYKALPRHRTRTVFY